MSIEKYKLKLEAAIYESCDKYYIGGKIVEEVLKEYHAEQLNLPLVSNRRELLCAFFKYFRDNGEANIGMSIEQFVDAFLSTQ